MISMNAYFKPKNMYLNHFCGNTKAMAQFITTLIIASPEDVPHLSK